MTIHQAIELIALLYFDAKIDQKSRFEANMCEDAIDQVKNDPNISPRTLALCWLYCQAHATDPLGQFIKVIFVLLVMITCKYLEFKPLFSENKLWVFDQLDLKDAVTLLLLNYKHEKNENDLELKKLISMQFENDLDMKIWAMSFFDKVGDSP